ncbi:hypothetical protein M513_07261, partial [Trichuris suis]
MAPSTSRATPMASELASTQTLASSPVTSRIPRAGSRDLASETTSWRSILSSSSSIAWSHVDVASLTLLLIRAVTTLSQPQTGRWPTSLPHKENTDRRLSRGGTLPASLSLFQANRPCSPPSPKHGRLRRRARASYTLAHAARDGVSTRLALTTSSFTKMSLMQADVPLRTSGSWESTQFTTAFIINGATFNPKPKRVRQYLRRLNTTV